MVSFSFFCVLVVLRLNVSEVLLCEWDYPSTLAVKVSSSGLRLMANKVSRVTEFEETAGDILDAFEINLWVRNNRRKVKSIPFVQLFWRFISAEHSMYYSL